MEPPLDGPVPRAPYALATNDLIGINTSGRIPLESVTAFAWNTHPQTLCYARGMLSPHRARLVALG